MTKEKLEAKLREVMRLYSNGWKIDASVLLKQIAKEVLKEKNNE